MSRNRSQHLSRRYFLRSSGLAVAIPALSSLSRTSIRAADAGTSSTAATESGAPLRMAFMSIPNGVQQDHWFTSGEFQLNETMKPLERLKSH